MTVQWESRPDEFAGLSYAVLALTRAYWEGKGASFVDDDDQDYPQCAASGLVDTALARPQRFAILDEGDTTALLVSRGNGRFPLRGAAVLLALAENGYIDLDRDVLQAGIGETPSVGLEEAPKADEVLRAAVAEFRSELRSLARSHLANESEVDTTSTPTAAIDATGPLSRLPAAFSVLPEDYVRDQLSAAEELVFTGHREPAVVAAGAGIEGAVRLSSRESDSSLSANELLESLQASGVVDRGEAAELGRVLAARDYLIHGLVPGAEAVPQPDVMQAVAIALRLLESLPTGAGQLTAQEAQIARLAAEGFTNQQIGDQLILSPRTVEWHLRKVFAKLGISSRKELRPTDDPRVAIGRSV
jgi:DNA-binding CsgD family transcriptional regulator